MPKVETRSIDVTCIPESELQDFVASLEGDLLFVARFGSGPALAVNPLTVDVNCPQAVIDLPQLGNANLVEVWTTDLPCIQNRSGNVSYSRNQDFMFGTITLHESKGIDDLAKEAYSEFLDLIHKENYPHLARVWNYFPNINEDQDGVERYKRFCSGRHEAFSDRYADFQKYLPAANAVGSRKGPLVIYFLASRDAGVHLENTRQVSAYLYPEQYGKRSPSFARATYKDWGKTAHLYVSGTASIVGHKSCHQNDPVEQAHEISRNISALLDAQFSPSRNGGRGRSSSIMALMKIYLRDPKLFPLIRDEWENKLGWKGPTLYLQGDICRSDLLLEIEGIWQAR